MAVFEEVRLTWNGVDYVIPPDRMMRCIAMIEEIITLAELHRDMAARRPRLAKLAQSFGAVLRYAGAAATDDEVYAAMYKSGKDMHEQITGTTHTLLMLMMPPASLKMRGGAVGKLAGTGARLSSRRTKQRSRAGG